MNLDFLSYNEIIIDLTFQFINLYRVLTVVRSIKKEISLNLEQYFYLLANFMNFHGLIEQTAHTVILGLLIPINLKTILNI